MLPPSLVCPQCGADNLKGSQVCGQCGALLAEYCPHCGSKLDPHSHLCERCGSEYETLAQAGELCQQCGSSNDTLAECCRGCGARLRIKCPRCGATTGAKHNFCPHCGFGYSRFVSDRVIDGLDRHSERGEESALALDLRSGMIIALITISIILDVYILSQI